MCDHEVTCCCSGPLPGGNITVDNNITSRFFAPLRILNISRNGFSGGRITHA
jgi:hypothetical protein